jgi:hypothetical protein
VKICNTKNYCFRDTESSSASILSYNIKERKLIAARATIDKNTVKMTTITHQSSIFKIKVTQVMSQCMGSGR